MSSNNDTVADIVAKMRVELERHERLNCWFRPEFVRKWNDSLEAAHEREIKELKEQIESLRQQRDVWSKRSDELKTKCDEGTPNRRTGIWLNGDDYEYEFAYCSECGRMQWAGWYSHSRACEEISDFPKEYKFCPNCGASMVEGAYVNGKGKNHGSK